MCFVPGADDVPESTAPEPPSNIVTSWGDSRPTKAPSQAPKKNVPAQPRRYSSFAAQSKGLRHGPAVIFSPTITGHWPKD